MKMTTHALHVDAADRGRHIQIPFVVAENDLGPLLITIEYDQSHAIIDLGLWDSQGWRGYSGGARQRVIIAERAATPGYRIGRLVPGRWSVELGVYRASIQGCAVTVTIDTNADPTIARLENARPDILQPLRSNMPILKRGSDLGLPATAGMAWYAGDFHAHSVHSDGELTLDELAELAVRCGLDFLAVTDHNTVSHHQYLQKASRRQHIVLIPGQEVTTDRGHANVFGDIGWIDFHRRPAQWMRDVRTRGGLMSINHPLADNCAWQWDMDELPPVLEFWHITWFGDATHLTLRDTGIWALWARWNHHATLIGGSDFHNLAQGWLPGTPTTWVQARDCNVESILEGVKMGRTAISRGRTWSGADNDHESVLLHVDEALYAMHCGNNLLIDPTGETRVLPSGLEQYVVHHPQPGVWRVESPDGSIISLTNVHGPCWHATAVST